MPTKYGFVCSLFGSHHSLIDLDPNFVYNFLSSILSFTLESSNCKNVFYKCVSQDALRSEFLVPEFLQSWSEFRL